MDSNGLILYLARNGVIREQLIAEGIVVTDSQLRLLSDFRLLARDGDRLTTSIPTIGPEELAGLRPSLKELGMQIAESIAPQVETVRSLLGAAGHESSSYAVVFGHALDGLLWEALRERDALPDTTLSIERPWWNGTFWAICPAREGVAGTNEHPTDIGTLVMVWTDETLQALNSLVPSMSQASSRVPVVEAGSPIDVASRQIAVTVASALVAAAKQNPLTETNSRETTVIVGHELIWDVIDALVGRGDVALPRVLAGARQTPEALRDLFFIRAKRR